MLSKQTVVWAAQHDWFVKDNEDGSITCIELENGNLVKFSNRNELRLWAGY